jgi:hypothetical protein
MRGLGLAIALSLLITAPARAAYKLVAKGTPRAVAKSGLTVTPPTDWNRLPARIGKHAESWTLDGLPLNEVDFYGGIAEGEPLIRDFDKKNRPLPRFSNTMLPPDIIAFYETSFRVATGSAQYETGTVEPAIFAGKPGFRFSYRYTTGDEVRRSGEAIGATIDGKLYLIAYNAPETHYFAHDLENFRKIAASARVLAVPAGK